MVSESDISRRLDGQPPAHVALLTPEATTFILQTILVLFTEFME